MFPSRITGPMGGRFILPGVHKRLGSIFLFYLALGATGALLVLLYFGIGGVLRAGSGQLSRPLFYLLVVWGLVTAIFVILLFWRGVRYSHEDDEFFREAPEEQMAREQQELAEFKINRMNNLPLPLLTSGIASALLFLTLAGIWLYNGIHALLR